MLNRGVSPKEAAKERFQEMSIKLQFPTVADIVEKVYNGDTTQVMATLELQAYITREATKSNDLLRAKIIKQIQDTEVGI